MAVAVTASFGLSKGTARPAARKFIAYSRRVGAIDLLCVFERGVVTDHLFNVIYMRSRGVVGVCC